MSTVARTVQATRDAVAASPDDPARFDADAAAAGNADAVLNRWWGISHLHTNPPTAAEHDAAARVRHGDTTALWARTVDGRWVQP